MKRKYNWLNHLLNFISVILGVYLAFYVNERANSAAERREGVLLMNSMINDLAADIKTYKDYQIPINVKYQESVDHLLTSLSNNEVEEVNSQLPTIFQVENYTPNTSTYNSMKSAGKIKLLADLSLQKRLSDYYDGTVLECMKKNEVQADFFMNEVVNWLTLNADLIEMKILDEGALVVLRNKLLIYESLIDQKVRNYELIVEESTALKGQLDSLVSLK